MMKRCDQSPECLAHPEQIVMATDLCDSNTLLPLAIAQAKADHAHLTLVHALLNTTFSASDAQALIPPDGGMEPEEFAERIMAELVQHARAEGVNCESVVRQGVSASEVVREEICRTGAQRLIMGTHGRGRLGQMVLGSVTKNLLRNLDIPIFAVGPKVKIPHLFAVPKRILCPMALAHDNTADAGMVRDLAESYGAELILMHVIDPETNVNGHSTPSLDWAKQKLDALIPNKTTLTVGLKTHVACGNVVEEILESVSRFDAGWIVLGWNAQRRIPNLVESVVYRVMAAAPVPAMAIPHRTARTAEHAQRAEESVAAAR